jgi:hypothetical protein
MAKNKNKQNKKKTVRRSRKTNIPKHVPGIMSLKSFQDYDRMLRDPCSAEMVHAPYAGTESAYLMRVTKNFFLTCPGTYSAAGVDSIGNFMLQIQASSFPVAVQASSQTASGTAVFVTDATSFLAGTTCESYRCVAACVKWVPIGAIAKRSGIIALHSSNNPLYTNLSSVNFNDSVQNALRRDSNGSSNHEINFLPSNGDETFKEYSASTLFADATTLSVAAVGVDVVSVSTTNANVNGYVEFTGIYEWIPRASGGVSQAPKMPPPFTTQMHQSTIQDVGAFLFEGVRATASAFATGVVQGGRRAVMQSISGIGYGRTSAPSMLTYR